MAANAQHSNWLGRGTRLGVDAYLGRPLQGGTVYISERDIFDSGLDLTLSAGLIDEWSETEVSANPNAEDQRQRLIANDSVLGGLVVLEDLVGTNTIDEYIGGTSYLFDSVERLWTFNSVLSKTWYGDQPSSRDNRGTVYQIDFSVAWAQSRTKPQGKKIDYRPSRPEDFDTPGNGDTDPDDPFGGDDPFADGSDPFADGDDPFNDDSDPFGGDDPFADDPFNDGDDPFADTTDSAPPSAADSSTGGAFFDYIENDIPLDGFWRDQLTLDSRTLNFTAGFQRDTRNDQIAPSRGTFFQLRGLYAIEFGRRATRVLDGNWKPAPMCGYGTKRWYGPRRCA